MCETSLRYREPEISVLVPIYRSDATLRRSLETILAQDAPPFEVVAVDSSPDDACQEIAKTIPGVRYERSRERLLPHAARNRGVELARGPVLVFTDPDVYPRADWLSRLYQAHRETGHVVVGALENHGRRWFDLGLHWTKFSKWVAAGDRREVDMAPTAGLLCSRAQFDSVGGFPGDEMLGDAVFSWRLRAGGEALLLEPGAVAEHHHVQGFRGFVRERYRRGIDFGRLETEWNRSSTAVRWWRCLSSALPLRLVSNLGHVARHAARGRRLAELLLVSPVVVLGYAASLLGEARGVLLSPPIPIPNPDVEEVRLPDRGSGAGAGEGAGADC